MNQNNNQKETHWFEGVYVGREFIKSGTKKDGSQFKLYKAKFHTLNGNEKYPKTFSVFTPMSSDKTIPFEQLEEGMDYKVGYFSEPYNHPQYGVRESRTVFYFGHLEVKGTTPDGTPANQPNFNNNVRTANNDFRHTNASAQGNTPASQQNASQGFNLGNNAKQKWLNELEDELRDVTFAEVPQLATEHAFLQWVRTQQDNPIPAGVTDEELRSVYMSCI